MIKYSFIIPHKNNPELLQRCVDSIPERDDIQIVIVDDNSDEDKKPSISRDRVEVVMLNATQSKGAGRARNVGMKRARGNWLLFADSDDFYKEGFLNYLDEFSNSDKDVIYFSADSVDSETLEPLIRTRSLQLLIKEYDGSEEKTSAIKYKHMPWNKMVSAKLIQKYGIKFDEVLQGNDTMFSFLVGYYARNINVIPKDLYTYTHTKNSITTRKKDMDHYLCGIINHYKQTKFFKYVGKPEFSSSLKKYLIKCYKLYGFNDVIKIIFIMLVHRKEIKLQSTKYVNFIQFNDDKK